MVPETLNVPEAQLTHALSNAPPQVCRCWPAEHAPGGGEHERQPASEEAEHAAAYWFAPQLAGAAEQVVHEAALLPRLKVPAPQAVHAAFAVALHGLRYVPAPQLSPVAHVQCALVEPSLQVPE